ncbi:MULTISPECIES: hypothetical protein [unclassified Marinobacter]|uniref:hypothetical protein n=1 Tax=unclassified Marinobacter TaxID=83889 RepID=UPI001928DC96|nr:MULTISPECIES: hypothetical protein [unclassified Marinobacter]MBL3826557.1 hypothetical protein [Marinobacter sp. MC3]MBL3894926.1 hypothetical protein [Marinobacter sp. MW3]
MQPMDPGVRLFRTWQFQCSIILPGLLAIVFFIWISQVENLEFEISSEGVRNLWIHHKLSLTLLGLTFPLTALVASHHRSVQASEQIKQQQSQNLLINHFAHTDKFVNVWEELELPPQRELRMSLRAIHQRIYPGSLEGNFSVSSDFENFLGVFVNLFEEVIEAVSEEEGRLDLQAELDQLGQKFAYQTGISLSFRTSDSALKPFSTLSSATRSVISTIEKLVEAASFLPPYSIRSLKSGLEHLEDQRKSVCDEPVHREQRLSAIGSSIESLLEPLGSQHVGNQANIDSIRSLFAELVESGNYTNEEIRQWFPWPQAQRRAMHLPDDLNGWVMAHAPENWRRRIGAD